jgi:hypothetical protein
MANEALLHLQHSESVVAQMAATILAGLVQRPELSSASEDQLIEKSAALAIKLAVRIEKLVKSDHEWLKKDTSSSPHG